VSVPYGPADFARDLNVPRETLARLDAYAALLHRWQSTINLVARATLPDLWRRHMLDSAQLCALAPTDARVWLDLGSGAGFPGLVVATLWAGRPGFAVHLVESDRRKCAFLHVAAAEMNVPAIVHACRIEAVPVLPPIDVISARALAPLDRLLGYAARFAGADTRLLLPKGQDVHQELDAAARLWRFDARTMPSRSDAAGRIVVIDGFTHGAT
jgi:16S rRNA (guanine527-N7)-methyltransferase